MGAVRAWLPQGMDGLEVRLGATEARPSPAHAHDGYQVSLIEAGATAMRYRGRVHVAPARSLLVVHPGEAHENVSSGPRTFSVAHVEAALLADLGAIAAGREPPHVPRPVVDDARAVALFAGLVASLRGPAPLLEREERLSRAFAHLFAAHGEGAAGPSPATRGREHRAVALAKAHMREHHDREVSLAELAAVTGLHKNYLLNVFTREAGLSPHRYLTSVRVGQAKRLLRRGVPPAQVAAATGFSDQGHLTRAFKRHVLVTPGEYRRRAT